MTTYALEAGHDVADASLRTLQTILDTPLPVDVTSQPLNLYPVREVTLDQRTIGYGTLSTVWTVKALPAALFHTFMQDLFSTESDLDVAVTIRTRKHDLGATTFARYNAYLARPVPGEDYTYERGAVRGLTLRFQITEAAS